MHMRNGTPAIGVLLLHGAREIETVASCQEMRCSFREEGQDAIVEAMTHWQNFGHEIRIYQNFVTVLEDPSSFRKRTVGTTKKGKRRGS